MSEPRYFVSGAHFYERDVLNKRKLSNMSDDIRYKRVLLKLSGEALMGDREYGIDPDTVKRVAQDIKQGVEIGAEVCVVVGAGNIFRGVAGAANGMERVTADFMGMMATVMNALAIQSALEDLDVQTRVQSAIPVSSVCEPFIRRKAMRHLEKGRVVIFAAGIGSPFFTTDTTAALRASEMECDAILKATKVDGIYDKDPVKHNDAVRYDHLNFLDVLAKDIKVMDASAITLARDNDIPIVVFSMLETGGFVKLLKNDAVCTVVDNNEAEKEV